MKNKTLVFIYAVGILSVLSYAITSCGVNKAFSVADEDVQRLKNRGYLSSTEELDKGYKTYVKRCGNCHHLQEPGKYTMSEWQLTHLPAELEKAKVDNETEKKLITYYIFSKSK
jgi:hypothetical protein